MAAWTRSQMPSRCASGEAAGQLLRVLSAVFQQNGVSIRCAA